MKQILIIEDEPTQQKVYQLKLGSKYNLRFAVSQAEALEFIASNPPDLVVLDVMLPGGKNGYDVLQTLKENDKTKLIPVIMITNLGEEQRETALGCGAAGYYTKTEIGPEQLLEIVERHI